MNANSPHNWSMSLVSSNSTVSLSCFCTAICCFRSLSTPSAFTTGRSNIRNIVPRPLTRANVMNTNRLLGSSSSFLSRNKMIMNTFPMKKLQGGPQIFAVWLNKFFVWRGVGRGTRKSYTLIECKRKTFRGKSFY